MKDFFSSFTGLSNILPISFMAFTKTTNWFAPTPLPTTKIFCVQKIIQTTTTQNPFFWQRLVLSNRAMFIETIFHQVPPLLLAVFLSSYLIGSIPFGYVIGRVCGLGDIRKQGSGNIGATNMLRVGNKWLAFVTLFSDAGKGVLAVFLAQHYIGVDGGGELAAIAVVLGHIFPLWLGFVGGKGVATTLGAITLLYWPVGVFMCLAWLFTFILLRISSVSAITALFLAPVFSYFFATPMLTYCTALLAAIVIAKHHSNIRRLIIGEEHTIRT